MNHFIVSLAMLLVYSGSICADTTLVTDYLARVRSLSADFTQTLYDEDSKLLETSSGRFYLLRPGRFRWDYVQPYAQSIVCDGEQVWIHDPELDQVTVKSLDHALGESPALLLSSDRPLEENFIVEPLEPRGELQWMKVRPRYADGDFNAVRLGFRGQDLMSMELDDNFGQTTRIVFARAMDNASLDGDLFNFAIPTGADVLRDRE